jgi:hypothetical protein
MARVLGTLVALILGASPAVAQVGRPPVELGVGISRVAVHRVLDLESLSRALAVDLRVTVPTSSRFALEGWISAARHADSGGQTTDGYYTILVKQRLVRATRGGFQPFVTYGAAGWYGHRRFSPRDYRTPDGSMKHIPGRALTEVIPPVFAVVGGGIHQELGAHLAVRTDAQLATFLGIPVGARFTASLSIPLGRYDQR